MRKVLLIIIFLLLVTAGTVFYFFQKKENNYEFVFSFSQKGREVKVYSSDGKIKTGLNRIKLEINPPENVSSFYFYMPPMPGMNEMRDVAKLEKKAEGVYEGELKISMDGPWQVKVVFANGNTLTYNVFVPIVKGKTQIPTSMAHSGHLMISPEKLQLIGVITEPVKKRFLVSKFYTVGYIDYDRSRVYDITLRSDAWVESTFGRFEGEYVKKGTPLMKVLNPEVEVARKELELAEETGDKELIRKAKEKLRYLKSGKIVLSPVSGVILRKNVYDGGYVKEGMSAYRIADLSRVWIIAEVPLNKASYIKKGQRVLVIPEDNPDILVKGVVDYIFPEVNKASETLRVRITAQNKKLKLRPNSLARVIFEIPIGEVLSVPESAVVDTGNRTLVFVEMDRGIFMPVQVKLGKKGEGYYEVKHGLKEGQKVVVKGTFLLDAEAQLKGIYTRGVSSVHHHH